MKKNYLGLLLATAVLGTTGATIAHAEEGNSATAVTTKAKVEFIADENAETPPTNPEKPGEPITPPEGGGETGGKGALRIDWASNFNFGISEIKNTGKDLTLPVLSQMSKVGEEDIVVPHFFQVSDARGLDNPEWQVSVEATALKREPSKKTDSEAITGAFITYEKTAIKALGETESNPDTAKPTWVEEIKAIKLGQDSSTPASQTLVTAKEDGARGTWSMAMAKSDNVREIDQLTGKENEAGEPETQKVSVNDDINLVIPQKEVGKIRKGNYTAQLNWNLSETISPEDASFMAPTTK